MVTHVLASHTSQAVTNQHNSRTTDGLGDDSWVGITVYMALEVIGCDDKGV